MVSHCRDLSLCRAASQPVSISLPCNLETERKNQVLPLHTTVDSISMQSRLDSSLYMAFMSYISTWILPDSRIKALGGNAGSVADIRVEGLIFFKPKYCSVVNHSWSEIRVWMLGGSKLSQFVLLLRSVQGLFMPVSSPCCAVKAVHLTWNEGELFLCVVPLEPSLQSSLLQAVFHLFLFSFLPVVLVCTLLSLSVHRCMFLEAIQGI